MSILLIAPGLLEPSTLWMRRQLEMISDEVSYLATNSYNGKKDYKKYRIILLKLWQGRVASRVAHYFNSCKLLRVIHSKNVNVVFIHYLTTAVRHKKILLTTKKPIIIHCHGYDVTWSGGIAGAPTHSQNYVDQVRSLPANVSFIANSKRTIQRLIDIGVSPDRIVLKYLGVAVPEACPNKSRNKESLTVLYLGRLVDFKGPDIVIRAFEKACSKGFNGELIIAGDGPLRQTCELLKAHSPFKGKIKLLGEVDTETGIKLRENADIFTAHNCTGPLSGQEEAFGVTMIEAMASGIPIINASNGSIPELLVNGMSAILLESGDIDGHANAFLKYQEDPEFRFVIAKNAWERVRDNFSMEHESRKLREILHLPNVS